MLKLVENPPMLPDGVDSLVDLKGNWWVAHTKSRFEKALAWELLACEIPFFLPMIERTALWGGRRRKVLSPLFPSYVFFCGDAEDRQRVFRTNRICETLPVLQRERFVSELDAIRRTLACKHQLTLYPFAAVGKHCRVAHGPMRGIEGIIVRQNGTIRVVLQVSILGQGAALEIDANMLEPAD